jgi:hypothetical protein
MNTRPELAIGLKDLFLLDFDISGKIGFLIAEQFDFGTAKIINNLFRDLLLITPFSKEDIEQYNELLSQRNLLVHHGGVFTMKYTKQKFSKESIGKDAFFNSFYRYIDGVDRPRERAGGDKTVRGRLEPLERGIQPVGNGFKEYPGDHQHKKRRQCQQL